MSILRTLGALGCIVLGLWAACEAARWFAVSCVRVLLAIAGLA